MKKKFLGITVGIMLMLGMNVFASAKAVEASAIEVSVAEAKAAAKVQVAVNPVREIVFDRYDHGPSLLSVTNTAEYTIYYSMEEELTSENYKSVGTTETPELLYAGEYDIYYYVVAPGYTASSGHVEYKIKKKPIKATGAYLEYTTTEYDGTEKVPYVVIDKLTWSIDYKLEYSNNIEVTTGDDYALVKIIGINNYSGYMYKKFSITKGAQPVKITKPTVNFVEKGTFTLDVKSEGKILSYSSSDPSVAKIDSTGKVTMLSKGVVTFTVKVGATKNYRSATKTITLDFTKDLRAKQTIKASDKVKPYYADLKFKLGATAKTKLYYASSNKDVAVISSKGVVTVKGIGETTITVKAAATSTYQGATKKVKLTIRPKLNAFSVCNSPAKGKVRLVWAYDKAATGYEIQVATNKNFTNAKKATATAKSTATTISNQTSGKTLYVRIRTYTKVDGKTYYGSWSKVKSVKVK